MNSAWRVNNGLIRFQHMAGNQGVAGLWDWPSECYKTPDMTLTKPTFPAPDHDHGRCTAEAMAHAEEVCARRAQKFTPSRRQVPHALLSSHRPLGAYEEIDELGQSMPRPASVPNHPPPPFLMENGPL